MRWRPNTATRRTVTRFAWWPITDPASGITVWLEWVQLKQERQGNGHPYVQTYGWVTTEASIVHRPSRLKALLTQEWKKHSLLWLASGFSWLWTLADQLISRRMPEGWIEANPYTRHVNGSFWWSHAIAHDACYFTAYGLAAWLVCWGLTRHRVNRGWAQLPGALALIYFGLEHFEGFLSNVWAHLGWTISEWMVH